MINLKRFKALFMAGVLTTGLCMSGMGVFAADGENTGSSTSTPEATPSIVKELVMADGITVPNAEFEFTVSSTTPGAPEVANITIDYTSETNKAEVGLDGVYHIAASELLGLQASQFPHAGEYEYTIAEVGNTYTIEDSDEESMTYDSQTYTVRYYIVNGENGLEISKITAENSDQGKVKDIKFTNIYEKRGGSDVDEDSLTIKKLIEGEYADQTKEFNFSTTLTAPATYDGSETIKAKLNNDENSQNVNVTFGTPYTFVLDHNDTLVFPSLPAGTTYTVTEIGVSDDGYTPSCQVISDGKTAVAFGDGDETADLTAKGTVGENSNSAVFTNTYDDGEIVITGVIINNLPFIILIAAAVAGIAGYVVVKRKIAR